LHVGKYYEPDAILPGYLRFGAMAAPRTAPPQARQARFGALTRGITRNVVALGLVSLLTDISSEMLVYLIPLFLANVLAASPSIIGLIEGIAESVASLLRLVSGAISDRVGRRKLLVGVGYGSSVVGKALFLVATSWPIVLIARVGDRVGKGIRTAPRDALITDSTPADSRGRAFGFHRAMDTTGAVIGVAAAAVVVWVVQGDLTRLAEGTFRDLVLLALVPGVLAVVTIIVGVHDVRGAELRAQAARARAAAGPVDMGGAMARLRRALSGLPAAYWLFVLATLLFTLGNSSDAFLALRSQQLGVTVRDLLLVIIAFNLTNAVVAWPVGALSDRVGRRGLIAVAWAIYAVAYAGFAIVGSGAPVLILWIVYGVYYGVNDAVGKALVADLAPAERRATAFGIINAVVGFALLPASLIAGLLWDAIAPSAPFWFGAGCAAAALVLLLVAVRPPAVASTAEAAA
jgi:MFS family permease